MQEYKHGSMQRFMDDSMQGFMDDSMQRFMDDSMQGFMDDSMQGFMDDSMQVNRPQKKQGFFVPAIRCKRAHYSRILKPTFSSGDSGL